MTLEHIKIHGGPHDRIHCPIRLPWDDNTAPPTALACGTDHIPVQLGPGYLAFVLPKLAAGERITLEPVDGAPHGEVTVADDGRAIRIDLRREPLTTYRYAEVPARPYFWPVLAPGGVPVTRAFPMVADAPGETHDHPHHRSLYIAFGSVNGTDNWSEQPGHGFTVHRAIEELTSGPVFGRFVATSDWTTANGERLLTQRLAVTAWRPSDQLRLLDFDILLTAADGGVTFGDTKEGGILSVRVASALDVPRGGRIENAYGGFGERETWGKAANWCDYSGSVEGKAVGIAILDHPESFRYPTHWHVRDYGLMTANPFGLSDFTGGLKDGSHRLTAGASLRFKYRLVLHTGDAGAAAIREQYISFVSPPQVEWS